MTKSDKHPGPWRWSNTMCGYELVDANGGYPIGFAGEAINDFSPVVSRLVLELIRLAPTMEEWIRRRSAIAPDSEGTRLCAQCGSELRQPTQHCSRVDVCDLARILVAIDAARKEP